MLATVLFIYFVLCALHTSEGPRENGATETGVRGPPQQSVELLTPSSMPLLHVVQLYRLI